MAERKHVTADCAVSCHLFLLNHFMPDKKEQIARTPQKQQQERKKERKKHCWCEKTQFVISNDDFSLARIHRIINRCVTNGKRCLFLSSHSSQTTTTTTATLTKTCSGSPLKLSWVQVPCDILIFCSELLKVVIILIYDVDYIMATIHNPHPHHTKAISTLLALLALAYVCNFGRENNVKYQFK